MNGQVLRIATLGSAIAAMLIVWIRSAVATRRRVASLRSGESEQISITVPSMRCLRMAVDGTLSIERRARFPPHSVLVFVRPRWVASFRLTEVWLRLSKQKRSDVAWTWAIAGKIDDAQRWISDFGLHDNAVCCRPGLMTLRSMPLAPTAIYIGDNGRALHGAVVYDEFSLARFLAACPNKLLSEWFVEAVNIGEINHQK
jgi:hypothetical protein